MDLPFLNKNKSQKEYFLALLLKPYAVGAILFDNQDSKLLILSHKEEQLETELTDLDPDELIAVSDRVISYLEEAIPKGTNFEKAIFAVPYSWIEEGKIKAAQLAKLKKLCEELGLHPMGFIMSIEAIVHSLQGKEGAPITALFVEIAKNKISIYHVKAGEILNVVEGEIKDDIVQTTEELLLNFTDAGMLPSKIILLDYEDVESMQQEFIAHTWSEAISFLHLPQVVVLEKGFENEAVINGVSKQMGIEISEKIAIHSAKEEAIDVVKTEDSEFFGFAKEEEILEQKNEVEQEAKSNIIAVNDFSRFSSNNALQDKEEKEVSHINNAIRSKTLLSEVINKIKMPKLSKLPFSFGGLASRPKLIAGLIGGIALIIGFSFLYYNYILSADISVFIEQKTLERTIPITFSSENSFSEGKIKINDVVQEIEGSVSKNTTGKKETGDKAKGELTIYNRLDSPKKFTKGTIIISSNDLDFVLSDDVNIASTSSFSPTSSSVRAKVEASKFGKEYNLPSNTNFTVKSFPTSSYFAKNDTAFSGGTKKETQVVSGKDIEDLTKQILLDLEKKAIEESRKKIDSDEGILPTSIASEFLNKEFDKKEGEDADSLSFSAKVKYQLGTYKIVDLEGLIKENAKGEVPESFVLKSSDSQIEIKEVKTVKNAITAKLSAKAIFTPLIKEEDLSKKVSGKNVLSAEKLLREIPGITDVLVKVKNKIPLFPNLMPRNATKIHFEIKT